MKKIPVILILLAMWVAILNGTPTTAEVKNQPAPLPADLLFTTTTAGGDVDYPRDIIVRVDAETLELSPFYVDNEARSISPVSWSPQGDLLAIYRILRSDNSVRLRQLCLLDRNGVFQHCFDEPLPMQWVDRPDRLQHYFPVAWSPDGQTIYFETEYPNEDSYYGYGKRLVEASVATGETLRVVYEYSDPYSITISPSLNHLVVGFGGGWGGYSAPAFLADLITGNQLHIPDAVPENTELQVNCLPFSPNGTYITVRSSYDLAIYAPDQDPTGYDEALGLLVIMDMQGTVQHTIGDLDGVETLFHQDCPAWNDNEQTIYFLATSLEPKSYVMRYSLLNQQLDVLYERKTWPEKESTIYSPLVPHTDGEHIALTVSDGAYEDRIVAVLYPDGEIRRVSPPYRFALYPLWVPPTN